MSRETIEYVRLDRIDCERQVRTEVTDESVIPLGRAIQEIRGLLQPIRVRRQGDRLIVVDGERRLRAARLINLSEIPAIVDDRPLSEGDVLQQQIIANVQRAELSPVERARAIQRLLDITKWPAAVAAGKLGLKKSTVSKLLALLSLPQDIRQDIDQKRIPASAGYQLARIAEPEKQASLARRLAEGELTRDSLAGAVKSELNGDADPNAVPVKRIKADLGKGRSVTVAGESLTLDSFIEVLQVLLAKARRARTRGTELKSFIRSLKPSV
jgi:ParB/RepB/Spo0J family partition protein